MRLSESLTRAISDWLLRPRGDAPTDVGAVRNAAKAPPPTRRCAAREQRELTEHVGSSAHAEMRPGCTRAATRQSGLLRPRGDAPRLPTEGDRIELAPPPTRRCAPRRSRARVGQAGSSAHAEMRPQRATSGHFGLWLLRPRGDAPEHAHGDELVEVAPPPTRRCAPHQARAGAGAVGSSAHAEMRPGGRAVPEPIHGLLRPRGDAPRSHRSKPRRPSAPPPTRRCARRAAVDAVGELGSSAHAEMRPTPPTGQGARCRLLRPRGDAPASHDVRDDVRRAPPPTRRCAPCVIAVERAMTGSSAHAEMRRRASPARTSPRRLLRPRGDAPSARTISSCSRRAPPPTRRCALDGRSGSPPRAGSSAHAEMRRCHRRDAAAPLRLLRPRGDAPARANSDDNIVLAPPPTRRCARERSAVHASGQGSSAHAEMRRDRGRSELDDDRLLRPRGDAPSVTACQWSRCWAPPPTRRCAG